MKTCNRYASNIYILLLHFLSVRKVKSLLDGINDLTRPAVDYNTANAHGFVLTLETPSQVVFKLCKTYV